MPEISRVETDQPASELSNQPFLFSLQRERLGPQPKKISPTLWALTLGALMMLSACDKKPPPPTASSSATAQKAAPSEVAPPNPSSPPASAVAAPAPATVVTVSEAIEISEIDVRSLLQRWLLAQNEGNYETYAAQYAERFFGIKRSGHRTRGFSRAAWLRDRKRMFRKAMQVKATSVQVQRSVESAVVVFEQSWASGSYKDLGPKQLVIVRTPDGLRIAREEMLASIIDSGETDPTLFDPRDFSFVVHAKKQAYVVLDLHPQTAWSKKGKLELLSKEGPASVRRAVTLKALPAALQRWQDREVSLFGERGEICRGKVDALYVLSRVEPHFGTVNYWKGEGSGKPLVSWRVAREAWMLASGGRLLVGRVAPVSRMRCRGSFWARGELRNEPKLVRAAKVPSVLARAALAQFRKLRGYRQVQKAYLAEITEPHPRRWDTYDGAAPSITYLHDSKEETRFVAVAARAGSGCGEFFGEFWSIWRVLPSSNKQRAAKKPPRLQLLTDERDPGRFFEPRIGADLDGEGRYEFISLDGLLQPTGPTLHESLNIEVPSLDCPC